MQYEFGFIGVGNMGGALAEQVSKALPKGKVAVCDLDDKKTAAFRENYGDAVLSLEAIPSSCRFLVLGVKPQVLPGLLDKIASLVPPSTVVVSMAAGISIAAIEKTFAKNPIIRIMPNTPCAVAAGVNAYACGKTVGRADEETFASLVSPCGTPVRVEEAQMNAVVGVSGSSPAYYYMMIDAVAKAGVRAGLKRDDAVRMAAQAMLGSAKMVLESGRHPAQLRDDVCSPGGTTIEAVCALDMSGFEGNVMDAVQKCIDRSREMSRQIT